MWCIFFNHDEDVEVFRDYFWSASFPVFSNTSLTIKKPAHHHPYYTQSIIIICNIIWLWQITSAISNLIYTLRHNLWRLLHDCVHGLSLTPEASSNIKKKIKNKYETCKTTPFYVWLARIFIFIFYSNFFFYSIDDVGGGGVQCDRTIIAREFLSDGKVSIHCNRKLDPYELISSFTL